MSFLNEIKENSTALLSALHSARVQLNMETAIIAQVKNEQYTIRMIDSDMDVFGNGDTFPLSDTYCAAVFKSGELITYSNVGQISKMQLHPVYVMLQLESYIGIPVCKNGQVWGTLNFSSTNIRKKGFSGQDISIVKTLAHEIETAIDIGLTDI